MDSMYARFKNVVVGAVVGHEVGSNHDYSSKNQKLEPKFPYSRPHFLNLDNEEIHISADHRLRPIIHPSKPLPYHAGYAECINAGKSRWNEDQAVYRQGVLTKPEVQFSIPYTYYGIFDGHAGVGAALCAANQLHHIIHEKLVDSQDDIWADFNGKRSVICKQIDLLVIGALESAFKEMDQLIAEDRTKYLAPGGCTACVALFILGKLYVSNAGDSRAILCNNNNFQPLSMDFTPESERDRIRRLVENQPSLIGDEFTSKEFLQPLKTVDLGKTVMFRDAHMKGWAYKTVEQEDLKSPVIVGHGKRSRLMGTIGVTRGFGDHDLYAIYTKVQIKPLLSCRPEVQVYKINSTDKNEVLVMGTDGLWDVVCCSKAAEIVQKSITSFSEKERYICAATCLVGFARGSLVNDHNWQLKNGKQASCDDISVLVIPTFPYKLEYEELCKKYNQKLSDS
ncbi:hypothetical protein WA026_004372 [Henosepilachna vigintioctopunctata]|uniref:PPM-type phosphatase domain-containing protein n=1 Tax=Henosepilachna vigintioctopunctata TaxID=420089 RepID=A0AAW1V1F3_9CUCU